MFMPERMPEAALDDELEAKLAEIARSPSLLLACDYDGTLAPIVNNPSQARPRRESIVALRQLASLPHTHVAVISGRALGELARLLENSEGVHLVGSHGSEFDPGFATSLPPEAVELRDRVIEGLNQIGRDDPGFIVEAKPASVAFHYRNADESAARRALDKVLQGPAALSGVFTRHGKKVLELAVVPTNKGDALEIIRHRVGATAAVFIGDDVTDEDAFARLAGPDVGIKVGPPGETSGDTRARFRVADSDAVSHVLAEIGERRAAWLGGEGAVPIERHSLLSDQRTAALVTPDARVVWLCMPRLDSPALFAELVGGPAAGHFSVRAADGATPRGQSYRGESLAIETRWPAFRVTDFLDCSSGKAAQRAGRSDLVRMLEGRGKAIVEFAPRLDYGRVATSLVARDGGLAIAEAHDPIVLRSPGVKWEIVADGRHQTARAEIDLSRGPRVMTLCYGTGSLRDGSVSAADRMHQTDLFWSSWLRTLKIPSVASDHVRRSALTLKALCHGPTGAIAAAATTSLPEHIGGVRNWDYRYCWLRDGAMSAAALVKLGSDSEAMRFLDWLLDVLSEQSPERLHPLYSVTGHELGSEAEISELCGYAGSRPVRIGNSAARQVQLDVFGSIVELIALLIERDAPLSSDHWRLVDTMVQAVATRWREPDHGIWEIRRPGRHHVHSKVMCWMAVDRAVRIAERFLDRERPDWIALRDAIAADVIANGFRSAPRMSSPGNSVSAPGSSSGGNGSAAAIGGAMSGGAGGASNSAGVNSGGGPGAFTTAYECDDLDAAALWVGLSGLLPPTDEKFRVTVEAIERNLRSNRGSGPTVYRYRNLDDGLPGTEGGFFICASWLVESYILLGRVDDAWTLFNQIIDLAGPTGLLPEQFDPDAGGAGGGRSLGNHPQAYSHIGLIENAIKLSRL